MNDKPEERWKTKDGQSIPIPELDDCHLLNIINWLLSKAEGMREPMFAAVESAAATVSGEEAAYALEQQAHQILDATWDELLEATPLPWSNLKAEFIRRRARGAYAEHLSEGQCECVICSPELHFDWLDELDAVHHQS